MLIFQPPGTTLRYKIDGYWHYGILVNSGYVIHNSKLHGRVIKESYWDFAAGKNVEPYHCISSASLELACQRAHQYLGMAYSLFTKNCEHFVRIAHGLIPESPQIQKAVIATAAGTVACATSNRAVQLTALCTGLAAALAPEGSSPIAVGFWGAVTGLTIHLATV